MIRISKLTDYGIVLLTHIGRGCAGHVHNARDLAASSAIPLPTVGKLLKLLTKGGLLAAHRGPKGGYCLARPAEAITVADIIAVLEGPIAITDCGGGEAGACDLEPGCPVRGHWRQINDAVLRALRQLSLSDMCAPSCASKPADDAALAALVPLASSRKSN